MAEITLQKLEFRDLVAFKESLDVWIAEQRIAFALKPRPKEIVVSQRMYDLLKARSKVWDESAGREAKPDDVVTFRGIPVVVGPDETIDSFLEARIAQDRKASFDHVTDPHRQGWHPVASYAELESTVMGPLTPGSNEPPSEGDAMLEFFKGK